MPKIFVSYRRIDSQERTHRIADWLVLKYGLENVFVDVDTIGGGDDFAQTIRQSLSTSDVILVIIGEQWVDELYQRALRKENDFVRIEVREGLKSVPLVIPVLLDRNIHIDPRQLPPDVRDITSLNYMYVRPSPDFHSDMDRIKNQIDSKFAKPHRIRLLVGLLLAGIILAFAGISISNIIPDVVTDTPTETPTPSMTVTLSDTPSVTPTTTETASPTHTLTPTPSVTPTWTATITDTPTLTPVADTLALAMERARNGVESNAEWEAWYPDGFVQESDGVQMVLVPTGCFMMGNEEDPINEQPVHPQCFETPFWIDQFEVTQSQFSRFNGVIGRNFQFYGDSRPVDAISWMEAQDFCRLRGGRLPTEAEWEYVARGPDGLKFPWGNDWNPNYAIWNRSKQEGTADVGSIPENASWIGALDMSGNVWEWTSTLFEDYPYRSDDGREQDTGGGTSIMRVLRGGGWDNSGIDGYPGVDGGVWLLESSNRHAGFPGNWSGGVVRFGFRCARDADQS